MTADAQTRDPDEKADRHISPFTMLFLTPLRELVTTTSSQMTKAELRVLLYLISDASYKNNVTSYIGDIADELGHDRATISKALSKLTDLNLVHAHRDDRGGATTWTVWPELAFRGRAKARAIHRKRWNRAQR